MSCHVVVVGAGAAALSFCSAINCKNMKVSVIEQGKLYNERNQNCPVDAACGVGGVGANIDGKISFFPAGHKAYLANSAALAAAYRECVEQLSPFVDGADMPEFPQNVVDSFQTRTSWHLKRYKSVYMSLSNREEWIGALIESASRNATFYEQAAVAKVERTETGWLLEIKQHHTRISLACDKLILAGGRFLPRDPTFRRFSSVFRRYEIGVRVCFTSAEHKIVGLCGDICVDPKWILKRACNLPLCDAKDDTCIEYRSFCFCRNGEVLTTKIGGWTTLSGRADRVPTNETNFGMMVRIKCQRLAASLHLDTFQAHGDVFCATCDEPEPLLACYGETCAHLILDAVERLFARFPFLNDGTCRLRGPCVEGVGFYPNVDERDGRLRDFDNVWAIGDCSGLYRGLFPSMLAGRTLAHQIANA